MATTKKQKLAQFRNLTKGKLVQQANSINQMLCNLPNDCKSLSDDEKAIFARLRECYRDILATWDYRSQRLLNEQSLL